MIPKISIIVLNWNGGQNTIDCLESLQRVEDDNFEIVLVDNNSTTKPINSIESKFENIQIIKLDKNFGYSGGNNRGFQEIKNNTDFVCFLNNDVIVDPQFLNQFRIGIEKYGENCIFGPKIYFKYPSKKIWFGGGLVNLKKGLIYHKSIGELDSESNSINEKTDYITGCCLVISIDNFDKLNGFDEQFNMYAEDVDLCLRAKNQNIDCMYLPNSKIWHKVSSSTGGRFSIKKYIKKTRSIKKLIKIHEPQLNLNLTVIKSILYLIFPPKNK